MVLKHYLMSFIGAHIVTELLTKQNILMPRNEFRKIRLTIIIFCLIDD